MGLSLWCLKVRLRRRIAYVYSVGNISFVGAPAKKVIKNGDAIIFTDYLVPIEVVVLGHLAYVLFDEIVDVLAEEIHVGVPQDLF